MLMKSDGGSVQESTPLLPHESFGWKCTPSSHMVKWRNHLAP
jgi:hypothetical protein